MLGDALCEGFSRVRREVSQVYRPHSAPNNDVAAGVLLKFAEEDKGFGEALVPGAGEHGKSTWSSREDCEVHVVTITRHACHANKRPVDSVRKLEVT